MSNSASGTGGLCDNNCEESTPCQVRTLSCKVLGECSHLHQNVFEKVVSILLEKLALNPLDLVCINCLGSIVGKACRKDDADVNQKPDLSSYFTSLSILDKTIAVALEMCKLLKFSETVNITIAKSLPHDNNIMNLEGTNLVGNTNTVIWECLRQAADTVKTVLRACNETEQSSMVEKHWNEKVQGQDYIAKQLHCIPVSRFY